MMTKSLFAKVEIASIETFFWPEEAFAPPPAFAPS